MQCPLGHGPLSISDRQGIEIDFCPECRGVWLDRGELDKILEREVNREVTRVAASNGRDRRDDRRHDDDYKRRDDDYRRYDYDDRKYYKKKKRESFLGELFDF